MNTPRCTLNYESGVTKAEMFPNLKTNSKHCSKTTCNAHAQTGILSSFMFLQLGMRTEALVCY